MSESKDIAKILVTGPFNAGKTTLIKYVSSEQLQSNDVKSTDSLAKFKALTTVGLDFGVLHVDDKLDVHLFGTPGQSRFNFMWKMLSRGALGTVFLVDSSSQRAVDEAKLMYQFYQKESDAPIVVGATKQDLPGARSVEQLASELGISNMNSIVACDPREKEDSKTLVLTLLEQIIQGEEADETHENDSFELE